ncbi:MAG: histidine ammonia-lyase [Nannocystaceae bacterium]|nr:histidine ammonia-lyase [bacterium]
MHASASTPRALVLGRSFSLRDVHDVASRRASVTLDPEVRSQLQRSRAQLLRDVADGQIIYGVNTGFGALSGTSVPSDKLEDLQRNLLRSHACGVGPLLPAAVVRTLLALRAHTLALGASGASAEVIDGILALLAHDVLPAVPAQGSVGASGDLAPLAHLALPLIGEGEVLTETGHKRPAAEALAAAGLQRTPLGPKEGLCLINGTQVTTAIGALATWTAGNVVASADVIGALSLDAGLNTTAAFDPRIHAGKPHPGQIETAATVRALVEGSALHDSHADCDEVQDAYCFRCMPQVHGAVRSAVRYVAQALSIELNSFTDNPLLLRRDDGGYDVVSGGNFHAGSVAVPIDHLTAAVTTLATISERRTDRFMSPATSRGMPAFLADDPGVESGFMLAHVTAAALASECKTLSFPASVDTIPTSAGKEDHVSMGPGAARKLAKAVDNVSAVLAVEAMAAARVLDLREPATSPRLASVHAKIREHVPPHEGDRVLGDDIEALAAAIRDGALLEAAGVQSPLTA